MTVLACVAQALAVAAMLYRRTWRVASVLFWVEMSQAAIWAVYPFLPYGSWAKYHLYHDSNKLYVGLSVLVCCAYSRGWRKVDALCIIGSLMALHSVIVLMLYAGLDLDYELQGCGLLWRENAWLGIFINCYAAWAVYTGSVGNPHQEEACQESTNTTPSLTSP